MALRTSYVVQPFELKRKRLTPGRQEAAPTESGALKRAEAMAGRLPGTMALKVTADDETGEVESLVVLGQFGEVPDDFIDGLKGG
jgi:hypothetical protein